MRILAARTLGAAGAFAMALGLGACGAAGPAPADPSAPAKVGAAATQPSRPLSKSTLSYLGRPTSHYAVKTQDAAAVKPPVSLAKAVDAANQQIIGARGPAQMSLVRYTNKVAPAKTRPGDKPALAVADRLAWALVYDGFQQAGSASAPTYDVKNGKVVVVQPKAPTVPAATTSLVMFVDAATGGYIESLPLG